MKHKMKTMKSKKIKRIFKPISQQQIKVVSKSKSILTIKETCKLLSVNRATLWRWTQSGIVIQHSIGGRKYYINEEILKALKKNMKTKSTLTNSKIINANTKKP